VATIVAFRQAAADARILAAEMPGLSPEDLVALGSYEVAARVGSGAGGAVTVVTGTSAAPVPTTGQLAAIRAASARRYGSVPAPNQPAAEVSIEADGKSFRRSRRAS
jgi:hypothetical protein